MASISETVIANRALQMLGANRIAAGAMRTEQTKNAAAIRACYDTLRRAEMRRNVWRFSIRVVVLRALGLTSMALVWPTWASGTTYALNDIVTGSDGQVYISNQASNTGNDPTAGIGLGPWDLYVG